MMNLNIVHDNYMQAQGFTKIPFTNVIAPMKPTKYDIKSFCILLRPPQNRKYLIYITMRCTLRLYIVVCIYIYIVCLCRHQFVRERDILNYIT